MNNKDLTTSTIERQNVLNNKYALEAIRTNLDVPGALFEGEYRFTKKMVADFYEVDERTIERYIERENNELSANGYILCKGKQLKEFKLQFAHDINVVSKTTQLGLFNFRSFLNIGMLLTESEKAKEIRSAILDIVLESINKRTGGGTKYINRRDTNYLPTALKEITYRKALTSAITRYVEGHPTMKYATITDYIYKAIFKENAKKYAEVLKLKAKDQIRSTMYAEALLLIAAFENGIGFEIKSEADRLKRNLSIQEVGDIITRLASHPFQTPLLEDARSKMASRDYCFRDTLHHDLKEYLASVPPEDFERFIGEQSIDFDAILEQNRDVLLRLKQAANE
jgi:hypothetical protein